ncbi:hypothetical protein OGAPHI_005447 [Ogataea philodendri]|uniref:Alpha-1,3-mannosyltransferase n=1 Tax=Ogataea philodendri TaxID=1378263 RepID=A0A9P8NZ90_9ASCO|nr:uncharacterized protein OGAPHI_005447 [Ogataea philodendri]KAH3662199.1 hypothetical protein OGAPHI_005447 [Ogataea philodendri]
MTLFAMNLLYNLKRSNGVIIELDDEYAGTFKEKYLKTITSRDQLYTDEFYQKMSVMGQLDDLVNEPIETVSFNETKNPYDVLKEKYPNSEDYANLGTTEKAKIYFKDILPATGFQFRPIQEAIYRDIYNPKKYLETRLSKWLRLKEVLTQEEMHHLELTDEVFKENLLKIKERKLKVNENSSKEILNSLDHMKFVNSFLFKNDQPFEDTELEGLCPEAMKVVYPWLSGYLPTFTKYNKRLEKSEQFPLGDEGSSNGCILKNIQNHLSGRGIVITASDGQVPELSALLALLRVSGNQLPLQIFHNNDLSLNSIKKLVEVATDPVMRLPKGTKFTKTPTLDLTFVDVSKTIIFRYKHYFQRWYMKLLAYLFSSYEEIIVLDTDTIPLLNIEQYFQLPAYRDTKTLFFRDREANSFLYEGIMKFFRQYLNNDDDRNYLQLKTPSEGITKNRFFGEMARHYMEAGLFAIDKKAKFDGVVMAVALPFFKLISNSVHGEKEFIWLGQEFMGQTYRFNTHPAVAVGELTERKGESVANELCSTHPGHISDDGKNLLWFNSGFLTCKRPESYYKDVNFERNEGKDLLQLKKEYASPLHITKALIPPPAEFSLEVDGSEPSRGWVMTAQCENYLWCAYDVIGGGTNELIPKGQIVSFNAQDTEKWDNLGTIWVNYFKMAGKGTKTDMGYVEDDAYDELGLDKADEEEYDTGNSHSKGGFASSSGSFGGASKSSKNAKPAADKQEKGNGLKIKKPTKGEESKDALDYEEYENDAPVSAGKPKKAAGTDAKKTGAQFSDADYFESASSGVSKGFKETDDYDAIVMDDEASREKADEASSLTKAGKNLNEFWNAFGFGSGNKLDASKLSSYADDSEISLEDIAAKGEDEPKENNVLGQELLKELQDAALDQV